MFWSVFRPSSGVLFCALRNYYVSTRMLCLVPVCGGMLSVMDRLCGLVVRVSGYRYRGLGFDSRRYQIF